MKSFNPENFSDRISRSAAAKAETAARHQRRPGPNDPRIIAQAAERLKIHEARQARQAERERLKQQDIERQAEQRRVEEEQELQSALAREAQAKADAEAAREAQRHRTAAAASNMADQKVLRDARYAARKSRQKDSRKR